MIKVARKDRCRILSAAWLTAVGAAVLALAMGVTGCGSSSSDSGPSGSATVSLSAAPSASALWVPNWGISPVVEFLPRQLKASGSPIPHLTNLSAAIYLPWTVVFDRKGDQWVVNSNQTVIEFSKEQLKSLSKTPAPKPVVTLTSPSFSQIEGAALDADGNLWVGDANTNALYEFTPSQLAEGGSQTPAITLTSTDLTNANELRFAVDHSGNLWIANGVGGSLLEFTPDQLAAGGNQRANIVITSPEVTMPRGLAFAKNGDLWVTDLITNSLVKFNAGDIEATGSPTPAVIVSSTTVKGYSGSANSLDWPVGVAFDDEENLWVSNAVSDTKGSIAEFTKSQVETSGSPVPKVFIDDNGTSKILNSPAFITFGPAFTK